MLPPIVIDLSLPEPLQQPVQAYEEKTQQLEQKAETALERLLAQLPFDLQPRIQTLLARHEEILLEYQGKMKVWSQKLAEVCHSREGGNPSMTGSQSMMDPRLRGDDSAFAEQEVAERLLAQQEKELLAQFEQELRQFPGLDIAHVLQLQALFFEQQKVFQKERQKLELTLWESWYQLHSPLPSTLPSPQNQPPEPPEEMKAPDMQARLEKLEASQKILMQAFEAEQHSSEEQQALQKHPQLNAFYRTVKCKLAEIFLAFKTLGSGLAKRTHDERDYAIQSISIVGELVPVPYVGLITKGISTLLQVALNRRVLAQNQQHSKLVVDLVEMTSLVETTARQLTWRYELQIKALSVEGAETLGECAVVRMLAEIQADHVQNSDQLVKELMTAVDQSTKKQYIPYLKDKTIPRVNPKDKPWAQNDVFSKPGIVVYSSFQSATYYRGVTPQDRAAVLEYGYRLGTVEEADALNWVDVTFTGHATSVMETRESLRFLFPPQSSPPLQAPTKAPAKSDSTASSLQPLPSQPLAVPVYLQVVHPNQNPS